MSRTRWTPSHRHIRCLLPFLLVNILHNLNSVSTTQVRIHGGSGTGIRIGSAKETPAGDLSMQAKSPVEAPADPGKTANTSELPAIPILYTISKGYLFFGLQAIGGTNPPDELPDPALVFTNQGPASLAITRYSDGPFGPWDQVAFTPGMANLKNTSFTTSRTTQAFTSSPLTARYDFPTHVPAKLAKFDWIQRSDGREDLKVYSPPNSTIPAAVFTGLYTLPGVAVPIPNTTTYIPANLFREVVSVISGFDNGQPVISGHKSVQFNIQGTASVGCIQSYEASEGGLSQGGILPVGLVLLDGSKYSVAPEPIPS